MTRIPPDVEAKVVRRLYEDAARLDWGHLTPQQRSNQYRSWVDDVEVGGKLAEYLSTDAARVWIKDGPMKEWARSTSGIGKYAAYIDGASEIPARLVTKALGSDWTADLASVQVKPLRMAVRRAEEEAVLTWAPASDLKHMVWAALSAQAEGDHRPWTLCVTSTFVKPLPANEKQAQLRLAARCGLPLVHVVL